MQEQTDEHLVRAFQRGDDVAFGLFVERHQDRVYRLAVMWLRDAQQADDVLQEAFLRSYTGLARFRFRASPSTWLFRVCRNVCREFNRARRFEPLDESFMTEMRFDPHFAEQLVAGERIGELRTALEALPQRQKEVVALRLFEELPVADTARIMGCRPGTVKAHLNKAVTALRAQLDAGTI
jgi:RNA polymerase sigma-70 factor (ECF subfamily)